MAIDILMAVIFVLLLNQNILGGLTFHEAAGSLIGLLFAVHVALNWRWVVGVSSRFFSRAIPLKTRWGYGLNVLLFLSMAVIIISGLPISKVLFPKSQYPALHLTNRTLTTWTHVGLSFVSLTVVGVHVGLHWSWIRSTFLSVVGRTSVFARMPRWISLGTAFLILLAGGLQLARSPFTSKVVLLGNLVTGKSPPVERRERSEPEGGHREEHRNEGHRREEEPRRGHEEGRRREGEPERRSERNSFSATPWNVLGSYLSIMAGFAIVTAFFESLWTRKPRIETQAQPTA